MLDMTLAMVMALICILLHFEAISLIGRFITAAHSARVALLVTWASLFAAHIAQIWLYAGVYWLCAQIGLGTIDGVSSFLDYGYFSAVVYTTLGFGDLLPGEGVRILAGSEALVGLCLIAWSATITYGRVIAQSSPPTPPT